MTRLGIMAALNAGGFVLCFVDPPHVLPYLFGAFIVDGLLQIYEKRSVP
jgi:hypothetical protein